MTITENISIGDIVKITRNDGKEYNCFVIESIGEQQAIYGRLLESSKDKVAAATWDRYGLVEEGVCTYLEDCESLEIISKGTNIIVEDANDSTIYKNTDNKQSIIFCLAEGYGGWSITSEEEALLEACGRATSLKKGE